VTSKKNNKVSQPLGPTYSFKPLEEVEEVEEVVVDEAQEGRATEEGIEDETERIKSLEGANG
jgi:hypothetical protein